MIIGTALGAWALFGNRRSSVIGGLGTSGSGMLDGANININGLSTAGNGITSPSAFQAWEKGCEDTLALQKGLYDWALVQQSQRFADRQTIDSELFGLYKSQEEDMYEIMKMAREKKNSGNEHFNESYAKYLVSNMYHYEGGRKYVGEKFSMAKAKEVCERYRGVIPQSFTHADVYVAINEHYHNCSELFKSWFGEDIDQKVIEAAILFWFKDDDCKSNSKLWNHFKEN